MTAIKAFDESGSTAGRLAFLAAYFATGLVVAAGLCIWRRTKIGMTDLALGAGVGAGSVLGVLFLLRALSMGSGVTVFPLVFAGSLIMVSLIGACTFHERMGRQGWAGVGFAVIALVLLA